MNHGQPIIAQLMDGPFLLVACVWVGPMAIVAILWAYRTSGKRTSAIEMVGLAMFVMATLAWTVWVYLAWRYGDPWKAFH